MKRSNPYWPEFRLDNRGSEPNGLPVTLADMNGEGRLISVFSLGRCREKEVKSETIPLPPSTPLPTIGPRLKCSECGGRFQAKPQKPNLPITEMRQRHR